MVSQWDKKAKVEEILDALINHELDKDLLKELEIEIDGTRSEELVEQTIQYLREDIGDDADYWEYAVRILSKELIKAKTN